METVSPHVRTIPVRLHPAKAPCPNCGKLGQRGHPQPPESAYLA